MDLSDISHLINNRTHAKLRKMGRVDHDTGGKHGTETPSNHTTGSGPQCTGHAELASAIQHIHKVAKRMDDEERGRFAEYLIEAIDTFINE